MSIDIKEYIGENSIIHNSINLVETEEIIESVSEMCDDNTLIVENEGLHATIMTSNYTRYHEKALEKSMTSWLSPYHKPVILHHNEKDGKIIGRICDVQYIPNSSRSKTPALLFVLNIPDEEGKKQILDGRLTTTSVGITAFDCRCSICNRNIAEQGKCEHERGQEYDGKTCYWDIYDFVGKELSYVITPSDPYTYNTRTYLNGDNKSTIAINSSDEGIKNMSIKETKTKTEDTVIVSPATDEPNTNDEKQNPPPTNIKESEDITTPSIDNTENLSIDDERCPPPPPPPAENCVAELIAKICELTAENTRLKIELLAEQNLRESLENDILSIKESNKSSLVNNIISLGTALGKPMTESEINTYDELSLNNMVMNYTNEITNIAKNKDNNIVESIPTVTNPIITESEEKDNESTKKKADKVDIAESFYSTVDILFNK